MESFRNYRLGCRNDNYEKPHRDDFKWNPFTGNPQCVFGVTLHYSTNGASFQSNDSGKTWVVVERTNETDNTWRRVVFFAKLLPATNKMLLRFVAQDQNPGSLVEAAVDDFEILDVETVTEVAAPIASSLPTDLRLHANYPNPFRLGSGLVTTIRYELPKPMFARVAVYDLNGRLVRLLSDGLQAAGAHAVVWNGAEASGNLAGSGFYFVALEAENRKLSRKILVLK
jgi:hypothetical protein